jgi:ribosomal-protein-alanine N-acetyltransferase
LNQFDHKLLRVIESARLTLVAATPELITADLAGHQALSEKLHARVPADWPPELFSTVVMNVAMAQLNDPAESGWSIWYLLKRQKDGPVLVGLCQFKGRPDESGSVEIAYSVLESYRNRGIATEAVGRMVRWAFSHQNVTEVTAETLPYLKQSIRIMEKNGFAFGGAGSEQGVVRYVLQQIPGQ